MEVFCRCQLVRLVAEEGEDVRVRCPRCGDVISSLDGSQKLVRFELKMPASLLAEVDAVRKDAPRAAFIRAAIQDKVRRK
jgi:hypothetical protein